MTKHTAHPVTPPDIVQSEVVRLADITPNKGQIPGVPKNPRLIRDEKYRKLLQSIKDDPEMLGLREILLYRHEGQNVIIGGNMRYRALKELGYEKAIVKFLPDGMPPEKLRAIVIKDNSGFGEWDFDLLANEWNPADLDDWAVELPELDFNDIKKEKARNEQEGEADEENTTDTLAVLPCEDRLYDSDNPYEIPTLRLDKQPVPGMLLPLKGWGTDARAKKQVGTIHFYVDDYRFMRIWKAPEVVLETGCREMIEPNFSLFDTTPIAYGLQLIYMKRWIARYWQECGARIYADLNVSRKFHEYNRLGIPNGYNAFATRGYADRLEYLIEELDLAREIAGVDRPNIIVYGGGSQVKEICERRGAVYVEQFISNKRKEAYNG